MIFRAWPTAPALLALLMVISEYFGKFSSRTPRTPKLAAWWWVAALIASYAAQLAIIFYAARHEYPMQPWRLTMMPLLVVDAPGIQILHGNLVAAGMLTLAAFQSYALLALYRLEPSRAVVRIGCGVMLLLSCSAPALITFDLYAYVRDALLGLAAYQPPSVPFSGEYRIFDLLQELHPTPYGPLWLVVVHLVTSVAPTLFGKLMALRALSLVLYLAMLAGMRALGMPSRIRNVAALNPALMLLYVAEGHNDLVPIVLLVWAAASVRVQSALAFGLIAAAGLVKLPFAVLGLPIIAAVRSLRARIAGSIVMLAAVAALSWVVGGAGYLDALVGPIRERHLTTLATQLAALAALALILLAAAGGRRLRSGVWIIPMLAGILSWYYMIWGLPYALARRRILGYLLVCLPIVTTLVDFVFLRVWEQTFVLPAVVLISILAPDKLLRRRDAVTTAARSA